MTTQTEFSLSDKPKTQADRVLEYIERFGSITPLEAMRDLGCYRLSARIWDLKRAGHAIGREMVEVDNRFGEKTSVARYQWTAQEERE